MPCWENVALDPMDRAQAAIVFEAITKTDEAGNFKIYPLKNGMVSNLPRTTASGATPHQLCATVA